MVFEFTMKPLKTTAYPRPPTKPYIVAPPRFLSRAGHAARLSWHAQRSYTSKEQFAKKKELVLSGNWVQRRVF